MKLNLAESSLSIIQFGRSYSVSMRVRCCKNWEVGLMMHAFSTLDAAAAWEYKYCWSSSEQARSTESTSTPSKFAARKSDLQEHLRVALF